MWTCHPQKNSNNNNLGRSGRGLTIPLLSVSPQLVEIPAGGFFVSEAKGTKPGSRAGATL